MDVNPQLIVEDFYLSVYCSVFNSFSRNKGEGKVSHVALIHCILVNIVSKFQENEKKNDTIVRMMKLHYLYKYLFCHESERFHAKCFFSDVCKFALLAETLQLHSLICFFPLQGGSRSGMFSFS